ncbi:Protein tyrosine kinase family protein [Acanthocheilonema viteae]
MTYKEQGLESAEWYHGLLPRKDINILLSKHGQFLVRETEINKGERHQFVLSVKWNDKAMHFIIRQADGKVFIEKRQFSSICELIRYHLITKDPITDQSGAILLNAVLRQSWEIRHEQIEFKELLGEGAIFVVYKGKFKDDGKEKEVAVKVHKGHSSDRKTVEQICREARIMRRLEHPNVVRLYGIAINKEPIMLLMELLKDGSLDVFLATKGSTLSMREKLYFCLDIASGLEFLHGNGIIHRDISSRNCLVEDMCVKISNFNLSREIRKQDEKYKITRLKQNLPIRWLAPETIKSAIYTTKSDVFSYGILLWEVFTNGAEPYCGMTVAEVVVNVKEGYRIPSPDTMPKRLQALQRNCFATEASERWSMAQIRKEIEMICLQFQD